MTTSTERRAAGPPRRCRVLAALAIVALCGAAPLFLLCGCDGGDDPGASAQPISGDSVLTVENPTIEDQTVYFDGQFIGKAHSNSARTWTVPSGLHQIRIDNAERDGTDAFEGSYFFSPAEAVILQVVPDCCVMLV